MKKNFPVLLIFLLAKGAPLLRAEEAAADSKFNNATSLEWSKRMADSQLARFGDETNYKQGGKWDYALHVTLLALLKFSAATGDPKYADFVEKSTGTWIKTDGTIQGYSLEDFSIDNVAPGRTVLELYKRSGDGRYQKAAATMRAQLDGQPRTREGGFWHKKRYTNQMWLDGLYMGEPFYAQYTQSFGTGKNDPAWDDIARQFRLIDQHLFDPATGLYYHGWDEAKTQSWANKQTGTSASFWGRAEGWWAMALVETLEYFPKDHPARAELLEIWKKTADGIVKWQDAKTGLWWQVLDQGDRQGNYLEGTAAAMFAYSLAKGVHDGTLPREFLGPARKAYDGILHHLIRKGEGGDINLTQCCKVAGLGQPETRDGTFAYYISEPIVENDLKGVGPFILTGLELAQLADNNLKSASDQSAASGWDQVPEILARIVPPSFAERDFSILDFGAVNDGAGDSTEAIRKAIAACHDAGGGRVVVPKGEFLTGAIELKSNVNLHVSEGATLKFSTDPAKYPTVFTRFEGMEVMNYSPFIYAFGQDNIAVTGKGTLDGQAAETNWWGWVRKSKETPALATADRKRLDEMNNQSVPVKERVFGAGHYLRPNFLQPYRCKNVLIEGLTVLRSPMWEINPVLCSNVTVRDLNIVSLGPNNDGCDPESCRDVLIEACSFTTGDDCIAIKSGRNNDGRRIAVASENIVVRKCVMKDGHGGVTIGSEISGDCRNVFAEDCQMDSPHLDRALRLKTNAMRGGVIENIYMRNTEVGQVADAVISINFRYEEAENGPFLPVVRNVVVENLSSQSSPRVLSLVGFEKSPIRDVHLINCTFGDVAKDDLLENVIGLKKDNVKVGKSGNKK